MTTRTEPEVEAVLLDQFGVLGYECPYDAVSDLNGSTPERVTKAKQMAEAAL